MIIPHCVIISELGYPTLQFPNSNTTCHYQRVGVFLHELTPLLVDGDKVLGPFHLLPCDACDEMENNFLLLVQ